MVPLLLQKPHSKSKSADHKDHLKRRLEKWHEGDIAGLLAEGVTIQARLESSPARLDDASIARVFAQMIFDGKGAMRFVVDHAKGGILPMNDSTKKMMEDKHPAAEEADPAALQQGPLPPDVDPVVFSALTGDLIKKCALKTEGAAGVSQADDQLWHKMVSSYKAASTELCNAVAASTRRLATEFVDPACIEALCANRGIPLNKGEGALRPIGIGELKRRIGGKAIMSIVNLDVQQAAGVTNLCAGQSGGVEAAVHSMRDEFSADDSSS